MPFEIHGDKPAGAQESRYRKTITNLATKVSSWRLNNNDDSRPAPVGRQMPEAIRIVCISDTHNTQPDIPTGDVLLHAGDLSEYGTFSEVQAQLDWLNAQPHEYKVVIAGNHDLILDPDVSIEAVASSRLRRTARNGSSPQPDNDDEKTLADLNFGGIIYLSPSNSTTTLTFKSKSRQTLNIFGSPKTPQFGQWAFQYPPIRDIWTNKIPDVDILLTHGPPIGILDNDGRTGDRYLLRELIRTRPKLVVFGHIHTSAGQTTRNWTRADTEWVGLVVLNNGGLFCILRLLLWVICERLFHSGAGNPETILINAAVVGGRDNEIARGARTIDL